MLQISLQKEADRDWALSALPRPWETFKDELDVARKYAFPDLAVPGQFENVDGSTLVPDVFFSVFAHQSTEVIFTLNHDCRIEYSLTQGSRPFPQLVISQAISSGMLLTTL